MGTLDIYSPAIVMVAISVVAIIFAVKAYRQHKRAGERMVVTTTETDQKYGWLGLFHSLRRIVGLLLWIVGLWWTVGWLWWIVDILISGLKFVYQAWKESPLGTDPHVWWSLAIAIPTAIVLFLLIKLFDRRLNGPPDSAVRASRSEEFDLEQRFLEFIRPR